MKRMLFVLVTSIALCVSVPGAFAEDDEIDRSSAGQTGQVQYVTSEGTVKVDLPDGFYLIQKTYLDSLKTWSIEAAKTSPDCTYVPALTMGEETKWCPGHSLEITWGNNLMGDDVEDSINSMKNGFGGEGSYTETASGETAWLIDGNEDTDTNGLYGAVIDYSDDESKWMTVLINPITEDGTPSESMTSDQFKEFVESISIE